MSDVYIIYCPSDHGDPCQYGGTLEQGGLFSSITHAVGNVAKAVAAPAKAVAHVVTHPAEAVNSIKHAVSSPTALLHAIGHVAGGPLDLATSSIAKATGLKVPNPSALAGPIVTSLAHGDIKGALTHVADIATHVADLVAWMPGVGTALAASINTMISLLEHGVSIRLVLEPLLALPIFAPLPKDALRKFIDFIAHMVEGTGAANALTDIAVKQLHDALMAEVPSPLRSIANQFYNSVMHLVMKRKPIIAAAGRLVEQHTATIPAKDTATTKQAATTVASLKAFEAHAASQFNNHYGALAAASSNKVTLAAPVSDEAWRYPYIYDGTRWQPTGMMFGKKTAIPGKALAYAIAHRINTLQPKIFAYSYSKITGWDHGAYV